MRYEDRLADPADTLGRALAFARIDVAPDAIEQATQATGFERLQAMEDSAGFADRPRQATRPFFGEGRAGGWRDALTKRQAARIEADHGEMMARLGYG